MPWSTSIPATSRPRSGFTATDDVDRACGELATAGVPVLQPPHNAGNSNPNALLRDPDGNLVEIIAKVS
jgi:lactoylglutathione lyase